jgi:hypothetical protein
VLVAEPGGLVTRDRQQRDVGPKPAADLDEAEK